MFDPTQIATQFLQNSNRHLFLTGKAGTGKTTFLKKIVEHSHKKVVIAAPTGIAAINAGGSTLHSLFQLPFGAFIPENRSLNESELTSRFNTPHSLLKNLKISDRKRSVIKEMELLIIDEVSMLRADLLDAIDVVLKQIRKNTHPFGGLQILFIGDLLQLPPVIRNDEWSVLKSYYPSPYFFDALSLRDNKPLYIELEKIYRQQDDVFIEILNHLRQNKITDQDIEILNKYYQPDFNPGPKDEYITLTTHNQKADSINNSFLSQLPEKSIYYSAEIEGDFPESMFPMEKELELKTGAQVMFIKNDPSGQSRFFNGKIGIVEELKKDAIIVSIDEGKEKIELEKYEWKNVRFETDEAADEIKEVEIGTFRHYPIKLAWAITVHKSQGLTFTKAIIDPQDAFAPGQVYVALSRLRSLDGLVLTSKIRMHGLYTDQQVKSYQEKKESKEILEQLVHVESDKYMVDYISKAFDFHSILQAIIHSGKSGAESENRSIRKKEKPWLDSIYSRLFPLAETGTRFITFSKATVLGKKEAYYSIMEAKLTGALTYFLPEMQSVSDEILKKLKELREIKKAKLLFSELLEIDLLLYKQTRMIRKAGLLAKAIGENKELSKEDAGKNDEENFRAKRIAELSTSVHHEEDLSETEYRKAKPSYKRKTAKS
ncbi:MAG: AAA family ATPase, partial [Flavobacteriales bacterium]|nr:AAA family ATPase [Flavobacteriales bacterium]